MAKHSKKSIYLSLLFGFLFILSFFVGLNALEAATAYSIEQIDVGLGTVDLKSVLINIIKWVLGILALVALSFIVYGGVLWMTARGNEEKIAKAKKVIINAVVGMIIVLLAWAIVLLVQRFITDVTDGVTQCTADDISGDGCQECQLDGSWDWIIPVPLGCELPGSAFVLRDMVTDNEPPDDNMEVYSCSKVVPLFNNTIDKTTVDAAATADTLHIRERVCNTGGTSCWSDFDCPDFCKDVLPSEDGTWVTANKTVTYKHVKICSVDPGNDCSDATKIANCEGLGGTCDVVLFDKDQNYRLNLPKTLQDKGGLDLSTADPLYCDYTTDPANIMCDFKTGDKDDVVKPYIINTYPVKASEPTHPDRNVSRQPIMMVNFSENIDPTTVIDVANIPQPDTNNVKIERFDDYLGAPLNNVIDIDKDGDGMVDADVLQVKEKSAGFELSLVAPEAFEAWSWYRVTIQNVEDLCGNAMDSPEVWWFQTNDKIAGFNTWYPQGSNVCPDTRIYVKFNTTMYYDEVSFKLDAFPKLIILAPDLGGPVSVSGPAGTLKIKDVNPSDPSNNYMVYELIPLNPLATGTTHTVLVETGKIIDKVGTTLKKTWSFDVTTADKCACSPLITKLKPDQGGKKECMTIEGWCFKGTAAHPADPTAVLFDATNAPILSSKNDRIVTTTPDTFSMGDRPDVTVTIDYVDPTYGSLTSNALDYFYNTNDESEGPCLFDVLTPGGSCYPGTPATLVGIRFKDPGDTVTKEVTFKNKAIQAPVESWADTVIRSRVKNKNSPPQPEINETDDGDVNVRNDVGWSNGIYFDVCEPPPGIPVVTKFWPSCIEACVNTQPGAEFSLDMNAATVSDLSNIKIYECSDEFCNKPFPAQVNVTAATYDGPTKKLYITNDLLTQNTWYRVVLSENIVSADNAVLGNLNYDDDGDVVIDSFSWTFRTRDDGALCDLVGVDVSPANASVKVGTDLSYKSYAFGTAECAGGLQYLIGANLALNQSFEANKTAPADNWTNSGMGTHEIDNTISKQGKQSFKITYDSGVAYAFQDIFLEEGKTYKITGWVKTNAASGLQASILSQCIKNSGGFEWDPNVCHLVKNLTPFPITSSSDWTEVSVIVDMNIPDHHLRIVLNLWSVGVPGSAWFDGLMVRELVEGQPLNRYSYDWTWNSSDVGKATITNDIDVSGKGLPDQTASALAETTAGPVSISAEADGKSNFGLLDIFKDPVFCITDDDCAQNEIGEACPGSTCKNNKCTPVVNDFDPKDGDVGTWVTIKGCWFGSYVPGKSKVFFEVAKEALVPDELICGPGTWKNYRILREVPPLAVDGIITVERSDAEIADSAPQTYDVNALPRPGICKLDPEQGWEEITDVQIRGKNFGPVKAGGDEVIFFNNVIATTSVWGDDNIWAKVPKGAVTGDVKVTNNLVYSNGWPFTVLPASCATFCSVDADCAAEEACGYDKCCVPKPNVISTIPADGALDICRNPSIEVNFDIDMDTSTFNTTNIVLNPVTNIRIISKQAKKVTFAPEILLDKSTLYSVNLTNLRSGKGALMDPYSFSFTTANSAAACEIAYIDLAPTSKIFTSNVFPLNQQIFMAQARSKDDQPLTKINSVYDWTWKWESADISVATVTTSDNPTQTVEAKNNGQTKVTVFAEGGCENNHNACTLDFQAGGCPPDETCCDNANPICLGTGWTGTRARSAQINVIFCDLPWLYQDVAGNCSVLPGQCDGYNFEMMYCRGNLGDPNPLPDFDLQVMRGKSGDVLKQYLFKESDPDKKDAIGLRVYANPEGYSPSQWYLNNVENPGSPTNTTVDGYEAVRDGRTVYVAATNIDYGMPEVFNNIYIISYNDKASAETIRIFNQMLENWFFNTNIMDPDDKPLLVRDIKRVNDLRTIVAYLGDYRIKNYKSLSGNLLLNSGFEANASTPDEWTTQGPGTFEIVTGEKHEGNNALKITVDNNFSYAFQDIDVELGKTYEVSTYVKTDMAGINEAWLLAQCVNPETGKADFDPACALNGPDKKVIGTNDWTKLTTVINANKSDRLAFRIVLHVNAGISGGIGKIWYDLTEIKEIEPPYPAMEAGTYLQNMSISKWPSWQATLGNALGKTLLLDPINALINCPPGYSEQGACWDEPGKEFFCDPNSNVYAYQTNHGQDYKLYSNMEYSGPGNWKTTAGKYNLCTAPSNCACFNYQVLSP